MGKRLGAAEIERSPAAVAVMVALTPTGVITIAKNEESPLLDKHVDDWLIPGCLARFCQVEFLSRWRVI
jgi:hypothetical protein